MLRRYLLRSFRRFYRFDRLLRRRLTVPGYWLSISMGAALVIGINTQFNLANQIFAFLLTVLILALAVSLFFRPRLRVQRVLPPYATAQEPLRYTLRVENRDNRPCRGLCVTDRLEDAWPSYQEFIHKRDPQDRYRNRFDRYVGYPRWSWLVQLKRGADAKTVPLPVIPAGGVTEITLQLTPKRRGYLGFQGFWLTRPDPFGVFNAVRYLADPGRLLVLPRRYGVSRVDLQGRRQYQPGGVTLAGTVGDSEEFVALRDYRPGDSLRHIHWRSWAKVGKPIVRENRPEYFTRHALVLDTFLTNDDETTLEEAVSVAASFLCTIDTRENLLDLLFVEQKVYRFTAGRGLQNTAQLLQVLACVEGIRGQPFADLENAFLQHSGQFSGCVLVLLGWDLPRRRLVQRLRGQGIQVLALVIADDNTLVEEGPALVKLVPGRIEEKLIQL